MSLQFIFGSSGAGKSHYLQQYIVEKSMENPTGNYFVIVPEQFTMQTQKDLVMAHERKGIMNIDVLSFGRLAHRIFEEVGGNQRTILDDTGKSLILRKIAGDNEGELKVLRGNLKKHGYIGEVKSVLSEFAQYNIDVETLDKMAENAEEGTYFQWKLKDIAKVYEGFSKYLSDKYITNEELLDVLCNVIGKSELLKDSVIAFDGFTGFTPVQDKVMKELLHVCKKVIVTVTIDEKENPYTFTHPYQLFALSKRMVTGLVSLAKEERTEIDDAVCLPQNPPYRFRENPSMTFLEKHLFRYTTESFSKEQDSISLHCAKMPKDEVAFVMQEIRRLVRVKGYRYRDIAVIAGNISTYADYMEKTAKMYDVPIFMDYKRSVLLNSFVEYIRSLLAMAEKNLTYESVFRFLRTGLTGFSREDIDILENYVIAMGIKGYKKWDEKWIRTYKGLSEEELGKVNEIRSAFVEKIQDVMGVLKKRRKTVKEITLALHSFFVQEKLQEKLVEYEERFQEKNEPALAKEYAQIYRIVIEIFDKFIELLGEEYLPLKEYCDLLDAGFEEAKVGVIPPAIDEVIVGDMERTRLKEIKVLFFVGANDVFIPGNMSGNGLLSEQDRKVFEANKVPLAPNGKEKLYIQKFYLYMNLTKPSDKVYISYSKVSGEGKSIRPAYFLQDLKRLYPLIHVQEEEAKKFTEIELTKKAGISYIISGLQRRREEITDEWLELYMSYRKDKDWERVIDNLIEAGFYKMPEDRLSRKMAEKLYGEKIEGSVTRLERFSACAFAHFLSYGLRLKERKEYLFEAVDLGNIFHRAIEIFSRNLVKSGYTWTTLPEETAEEMIEESVEMSITDYGNTVLYSSARNEYMITRIKRMMKRTVWALAKQLEKGDFVPSGYEVSFGKGKIDRIDIYETDKKVYVKVIDYKTGTKTFSLASLYHGLQLQLAMYMNMAVELERRKQPDKEVVPAGLFYYQLKDPIIDKVEEEKWEETVLSKLRLDGIVNADEEVINHLDKKFTGSSLAIPVGKNKNGSLSKSSKAFSETDFAIISQYVDKEIREIEERMQEGEIDVAPYEMGTSHGCDFCQFKGVCHFDEKIEGCAYRKLRKLSDEEVLKKMTEEL
ncbi:PD-(D/E)XK nuclease family protein [Faecalimonas sp.]|nr:PD-(D/E)XK nuclease family protein [Lachnospiraceae bacterium]